MNKNIIILFALKKEANSLLNQSGLKFKKLSTNEFFCTFNNYNITVNITGIGGQSLKKTDNINIKNNALIIKAGTCAILDNKIPLLTPIIPKFVGHNEEKIDVDLSLLDIKIKTKIKPMVIDKGLITLEKPLLNKIKAKEYFNNNFIAADMETFYLISKYKKTPFIPLLVGTDRGDKKSVIEFIINLSKASHILKDEIIKIINN